MGLLAPWVSRGMLDVLDATTIGGLGVDGVADGVFESFLVGLVCDGCRGSSSGTSMHIMVRRKRVKPLPERFPGP